MEPRPTPAATRRRKERLGAQALEIVFPCGYLYQYECMATAATCKTWCAAWKQVEEQLPESALIELLTFHQIDQNNPTPAWASRVGVQNRRVTHQWLHTLFDKLNRVRVQADPQAFVPQWGIDVQVAMVYIAEEIPFGGEDPRMVRLILIDFGRNDDRTADVPWYIQGATSSRVLFSDLDMKYIGVNGCLAPTNETRGRPIWPFR